MTFTKNTPDVPYVARVNDYVLAWDGKRKLKGYVESVGLGNFKMYYGPTFPESHVIAYIKRDGKPFKPGTDALPADVL